MASRSCLLLAGSAYGGAVYINQTSTREANTSITISGKFCSNTSPFGGAVFIVPVNNAINIHDSLFEGNAAPQSLELTDDPYGSGEGGAINILPAAVTRASTSTMMLTDSIFQDNWAWIDSGGVSVGGVQNMSVQSCTFTNNTSVTDRAGALSFAAICQTEALQSNDDKAWQPDPLACQVGIVDSTFRDNVAALDGAVWLSTNGFLSFMTNTSFNSNTAQWGAGALDVEPVTENAQASIFMMSDMLFNNNTVTNETSHMSSNYNAGAVYLEGLLCAAVINSTFYSNRGNSTSLGIGALNSIRLLGSAEDCLTQTSVPLPRGFHQQPQLFDPTHMLVSSPDNPEGYPEPTAMDIRQSSFIQNYGGLAGAISFTASNDNNATISYCTFVNNACGRSGGAFISWFGPATYVTQSLLTDMYASWDGGAILVKECDVTVNGSVIQDCIAGRSGGAIAAQQSNVLVLQSTVSDNTAGSQGGGAVACTACPAAVLYDSVFSNNTSNGVGGVLAADADTKVISITYVQADGNRQVICYQTLPTLPIEINCDKI